MTETTAHDQPIRPLETNATPEHMSFEAFQAWANEDTWAEWVDGKVILMAPAGDRHQDVSGFLTALLRIFVGLHDLGALRPAPFQMRLEHSAREPDLLFVRREHLARLKPTHLDGPADLVIEIISPESAGRDRGDKFYEYAAARVAEYWLIDPLRETAELYQLAGDRYELAFSGGEGRYHAKQIAGFWLEVSWLWRKPLPPVLKTLGQVADVDPELMAAFERALKGNDASR